MAHLHVGSPLDKSTDVGTIVASRRRSKASRRWSRRAWREGAELYQGTAPEGCYYPPTLATNVEPASMLATEEIFGPVATLTTFRTPEDAILLANNTRYGLAASIWSESINQALGIAAEIKAGVVWINSTNVFDAGAGFGGYRESGYGREGGREGMLAYLELPGPSPRKNEDDAPAADRRRSRTSAATWSASTGRPSSISAASRSGPTAAMPIRSSIPRAASSSGWPRTATARTSATRSRRRARPQDGAPRPATTARRSSTTWRKTWRRAPPSSPTGCRASAHTAASAKKEVQTSIQRCFWYAAQADKFDGMVHSTQSSFVTLAMHEPVGVMGLVCPTAHPLLGVISLVLPALAMGNRVVAIPSQTWPLSATDLYQVLETSDIPAGVVNIVTGDREDLVKTLAAHDGVDGIWYFGSVAGIRQVEELSIGNVKQTWTEPGGRRDWLGEEGYGRAFLYKATQVKNIWVPYGE